ncbi:MAG: hypothetical protein Q4E17_05200 [Synergistes sp.]|nr:hypothetical protein [Synergistes sp.]
MKKISAVLLTIGLSLMLCTASCASEETWDTFVYRMECREKIESVGKPYFEQTALLAPQGNIYQLWKISCSDSVPERRASASAALVKALFPDGDPSRWQEVSGFFPQGSYIPKQLIAVNALFNAIIELGRAEGDGKFAAAYLLKQFGKSSAGRLYFIDTTTEEIRKAVDTITAETNMPGDWSTTEIKGTMPFVRYFDGARTRDYVEFNKMQYIDGSGRISENGLYAWDRRTGRIYIIAERSPIIFGF